MLSIHVFTLCLKYLYYHIYNSFLSIPHGKDEEDDIELRDQLTAAVLCESHGLWREHPLALKLKDFYTLSLNTRY